MAPLLIPGTNTDVSNGLEATTRAAVLLGGIAYFTGLVVVNIHLGEYGVNVLGFFAPQYVTAGLLALLPAILGGGLWVIGSKAWTVIRAEVKDHEKQWQRIALALMYTVIVLLGMGVLTIGTITALFWLMQIGGNPPASWYVCVALVPLVAANYKLFVWTSNLGRAREGPAERAVGKVFAHGLGIAVSAVGVAGYLTLFGRVAYREVPPQWGGGGFTEAGLIVAPSVEPELRRLGALDSGRVATVGLLLVTNEAVVVCAKGGATLLLKRDVLEVLVLRSSDAPRLFRGGGGSILFDCPGVRGW